MNKHVKSAIKKIQSKLKSSDKTYTLFYQGEFKTKEWHVDNMRQSKQHFIDKGYSFNSFIDLFSVYKKDENGN